MSSRNNIPIRNSHVSSLDLWTGHGQVHYIGPRLFLFGARNKRLDTILVKWKFCEHALVFELGFIYGFRLMPVISKTRCGCTNIRSSQPRRLAGDNDLCKLQLHSSDKPCRHVFVELEMARFPGQFS